MLGDRVRAEVEERLWALWVWPVRGRYKVLCSQSHRVPLVWSQPFAQHIAWTLALQDEGPRLCTRFAIAAGYSDPSGIAFHSGRFTVHQLVIKAPIRLKAQAITGGFRTEFLPLGQFPEFIHEKLGRERVG